MSPADRAFRLFVRVQTAFEQGNTAEVQQFLPMAIAAHDMARPLNVDQLYHLALLHKSGGDHAAALTVAREAMVLEPDHLLPLMAGAEAAREVGDQDAARQYAARYLEVYTAQMARALEEYVQHTQQLEAFRQVARELTGG